MDMARIRDQNGTYSGVREIGGTLCYAAPEQHEGDDAMISEKCDVFSLSIILSILLLEYHPFFTSTDCFQDAKNGVFTLPDRGYHSNIMSILKKSLHPKPDLRPAIAQLLATFRHYAATSFSYQRCGIVISCGDYEYTYWNDTVLANQDLRGFGITLPSQGGLRLLIDQKKGEYGVQALNGNIPITFNNRELQSGKPFWLDKKNNNLSVYGKKLSLQLVEE
jgi:serine/threonine protein kinase